MINEIHDAIRVAARSDTDNPGSVWLNQYSSPNGEHNQFVIFLKPEVLNFQDGVRVDDILHLVFDTLTKWNVKVGAIRILTASYLKKHLIMDRHYGVINDISKRGTAALSSDSRAALDKIFKNDLESGMEILGGHQVISRFPFFSPQALSTLSDNMGTKKLASGTYCLKVRIDGKPFLVLNPFHPFQLEYFTAPGRLLVILEGESDLHWRDIRQQMIGATNPTEASSSSIRRQLLDRASELGIREISQGSNGIHFSAGPLEGMVEVQRFFSEPENGLQIEPRETSFGKQLATKGLHDDQIAKLGSNPTIDDSGRSVPAFDLTEEMDSHEAATTLSTAMMIAYSKGH